jgi:lipoyl(octanoyl) transferase
MTTCGVLDLGLQPYQKVLTLQRTLISQLKEGLTSNTLIICSHPPVITIGKSGKASSIKEDIASLNEQGVAIFEVERGGDATYHGPGQIVGYPLLDLNPIRRDVGWYVRTLEQVIIATLADFGVAGTLISGKTGVWVEHDDEARKIASLGVKLSRWCTMHGFSCNVLNCQDGFRLINPCGMPDVRTTSIEEETGVVIPLAEVALSISRHFLELFEFNREEQ